VLATADGVITFQGRNGGYGNMVELRHANGYTTRYAHLSRFAKGQSRGTKVLKGQVIGYVGATGLATGPHLHYELRERGRPIDARRAQLPDGAPVPEKHMDAYLSLVQERTALLERARPMYALSGAGSTSAP
jgi:murein DD-endopeptidase MepM/ murein hydrolase activator NlpD